MPKYKRKVDPNIDAVQFTDKNSPPPGVLVSGGARYIETENGKKEVFPGDWIVIDGAFHDVIKDIVFRQLYDVKNPT